jgi:hypothetical protein
MVEYGKNCPSWPKGVARGSAFFGGVHRDELVMALLRPEWEAHENARGTR